MFSASILKPCFDLEGTSWVRRREARETLLLVVRSVEVSWRFVYVRRVIDIDWFRISSPIVNSVRRRIGSDHLCDERPSSCPRTLLPDGNGNRDRASRQLRLRLHSTGVVVGGGGGGGAGRVRPLMRDNLRVTKLTFAIDSFTPIKSLST